VRRDDEDDQRERGDADDEEAHVPDRIGTV
jgi:hypothetical protein